MWADSIHWVAPHQSATRRRMYEWIADEDGWMLTWCKDANERSHTKKYTFFSGRVFYPEIDVVSLSASRN